MISAKDKPKSGLDMLIAIGKGKPKMDAKGDTADSDMEEQDETPEEENAEEGDEDENEEKDDGKQYLQVPKGFAPPSDVPMGGSFSGTFRGHMDKDGELCIEALNNIPLDQQKEPDDAGSGDTTDAQNAPQDINAALKQQYQ